MQQIFDLSSEIAANKRRIILLTVLTFIALC
jgi:hypothetical protein